MTVCRPVEGNRLSLYTGPDTTPVNRTDWSHLSELRDSIVALVADWAYERREEPFELSQGYLTHDYIDAKRLLAADVSHAEQVGAAILELTRQAGVDFQFVGGMAFGAAPVAWGVSLASARQGHQRPWFTVLKQEKAHGKKQQIVGVGLPHGTAVLLVDDVATTGQSIIDAYNVLDAAHVDVVMAVTLVDRGDTTRVRLKERGIPYEPVVTYADLGIVPVPDTRVAVEH